MPNNEETKIYDVHHSSTDKKQNGQKITKKKTTRKKHLKKWKWKPIYLVPIIFVAIVLIVMLYVWNVSRHEGPVYGNRCEGVPEISDTVINDTVDELLANDADIADLSIVVNCKTINIDLKMAEGADADTATTTVESILKTLDSQAGLAKSNEDSIYSDLLTGNEDTMTTTYHVDITVSGSGDHFPIFASKHPSSDEINFTYNSAKDPDLVDKLYEQQAEEEENSEEGGEQTAE